MQFLECRIPPVLVLLIAGLGAFFTKQVYSDYIWIGEWQRGVSVLLLIAGILVAVAGVISFKRANTTVNPVAIDKASALVTTGIFQYTRNPMYLGMLLVLTAYCIKAGVLMALIWPLLFVVYMNRFQIVPEEKALTGQFGQVYIDYTLRVRRWC
ncbi:isoprenylcysteine carboxylmethyltransferase family protein [Alteromonas sediminis]|uniref:Isoprenylcysteine carboxylmethyltransferase family protein n=1 Tax=Alteromonas sediminis TaxID=2259342 RepID=A0A3N5YBH5_9ALTE|nr:isoprenylcysteine carboxylmethyltransferase family protein [Alteromonas sediminis]RPJ66345.1 isoprenylcysteine carboxylmethyltransferase family protein [Alteromonas sediminis]